MSESNNESDPAPHVLVVEDDERISELLDTILAADGYRTVLATDGHDAIRVIDREALDVVILDRMLPGLPGDAVLEHLRSRPRTERVPVLYLTAVDDVASLVEGLDAGANDYVTKPFNSATLLARVRSLVRAKQQGDELNRQYEAVEERNLLLTVQNAELARLDEFKTDVLRSVGDAQTGYLSEILTHAKHLADAPELSPVLHESAEALGQLVGKIEQTLRPHGIYERVEAALQGKPILIAEADPRFRRLTARAVVATGAAVDTVENVKDGLAYLAKNHIDAMFVDWENVELIKHARRLYPGMQAVLMTDVPLFEGEGEQMLQMPLSSVLISNILARTQAYDPMAVRELVTTAGKLLTGDIFGLEKYLGWGTAIHERQLTHTDQRRALVKEVRAYGQECGLRRRQCDSLEVLADELLMNAIWDAPINNAGESKYADLPRKGALELLPHETVTLRYGSNGNIVGISVTDSFGRLEHQVAFKYLVKCFAKGAEQLDNKPGGAGLGMFMAYRSVTSLIINVASNKRTEVIGLLDMNRKAPTDLADDTRSFCYFRTV